MIEKDMVCIVCPIGCRLTVTEDNSSEDGYKIIGNKCLRGITYGVKEMTNPTRMLTTTVVIDKGLLKRLPVRTDNPISKSLIFECMKAINNVRIEAPIKMGTVIIENILDSGVNIIATRDMDLIECSEVETM